MSTCYWTLSGYATSLASALFDHGNGFDQVMRLAQIINHTDLVDPYVYSKKAKDRLAKQDKLVSRSSQIISFEDASNGNDAANKTKDHWKTGRKSIWAGMFGGGNKKYGASSPRKSQVAPASAPEHEHEHHTEDAPTLEAPSYKNYNADVAEKNPQENHDFHLNFVKIISRKSRFSFNFRQKIHFVFTRNAKISF